MKDTHLRAAVEVVAAGDDSTLAAGAGAAALRFAVLEPALAPTPAAAAFFLASAAAATLSAKPARISAALPLRDTPACGDIGMRP
mgnify:CR=1 FL=1|jgi:hypothetical protein